MTDAHTPATPSSTEADGALLVAPSGDTTGIADATALTSASRTLGSEPGVVRLTRGVFHIRSEALQPFRAGQSLLGAGKALTTINAHGVGDALRICDPAPWVSFASTTGGPRTGGTFAGFTIDGTGAGAGSCGIHAGDLLGLDIRDVRIQNFAEKASTGLWLDSVVTWLERSILELELNNNANQAVFDNHIPGNPYTSASYGYSQYLFTMTTHPDQNGVVVRNGASLVGVEMAVRGNFLCGETGNSGIAFSVGRDGSGLQSMILGSRLSWQVETDGVGIPHVAISLGPNAAAIARCEGVLHFLDGNGQAFSRAEMTDSSIFGFNGVIHVPGLGETAWGQGGRSSGTWTGAQTGIFDGVVYPVSGNYVSATLTPGDNAFAWDAGSVANMQGQSCTWEIILEQPATGDGLVTWPSSFRWLGGAGPALSTVGGGADHVRVVTFDFSVFYAQHLGVY